MEIKTLHDNPWLSLKQVRYPQKGIMGYVFSHESRCQGKIVAILPYQRIAQKDATDEIRYLVRKEVTPCWHLSVPIVSAITGGFEKNYGIEGTVVKELKEEGGYTITEEDLQSLGTCFASKSADTVYHLFTADLTGLCQGEATGDGSLLEEIAECPWVNGEAVLRSPDAQLHTMYARLRVHV